MAEKRTFWDWISENPITAVMILLAVLGGIALICGYREGFMSILTGLFGGIKGDDAENKRRLEETRKRADGQYSALAGLTAAAREQRTEHDREVTEDAKSAKAECDDMDIDELVDIGNAMLAEHGAFRGEEN